MKLTPIKRVIFEFKHTDVSIVYGDCGHKGIRSSSKDVLVTMKYTACPTEPFDFCRSKIRFEYTGGSKLKCGFGIMFMNFHILKQGRDGRVCF